MNFEGLADQKSRSDGDPKEHLESTDTSYGTIVTNNQATDSI